jgi:hypothetical protein
MGEWELHLTGSGKNAIRDEFRRDIMARMTQTVDLDDPIRWIGPDSTVTFDSSISDPTERAASEYSARSVEDTEPEDDDDDEDDEDEDDADEEIDEDDEETLQV